MFQIGPHKQEMDDLKAHENMFSTMKKDGKLMKLFYVTLVQEYNFKKITLNVHCSLC